MLHEHVYTYHQITHASSNFFLVFLPIPDLSLQLPSISFIAGLFCTNQIGWSSMLLPVSAGGPFDLMVDLLAQSADSLAFISNSQYQVAINELWNVGFGGITRYHKSLCNRGDTCDKAHRIIELETQRYSAHAKQSGNAIQNLIDFAGSNSLRSTKFFTYSYINTPQTF